MTRGLLTQHPLQPEKCSEAKEQENYDVPGRDAGQIHSQTPSLHQDQLNTSTHFNLADLLWVGRILPSVLPAVGAEPV